ncbi:MAG: hypothetical protein OIF50_06260, partial [Flavobacteriaceae bacterium]|nr:hypothetical protein [Flavobacteriaceae bacterium]
KRAERMERTNWQTLQKKSLQRETPPDETIYKISAKLDVQSSHKHWNWDCGLLAIDYGSENTGYIRTII